MKTKKQQIRPNRGKRGLPITHLTALAEACKCVLLHRNSTVSNNTPTFTVNLYRKYQDNLKGQKCESQDYVKSQFKLLQKRTENLFWYECFPSVAYLSFPAFTLEEWTFMSSTFYLLANIYQKYPLLENWSHSEAEHVSKNDKSKCLLCCISTIIYKLACGFDISMDDPCLLQLVNTKIK